MGQLPAEEKVVAVALFNHADDEGFFRAEPALVRAAVNPYEEDLDHISGILRKLSGVRWIEIREHPEQGKIGLILNFTEHQKISHPTPSKLKRYWDDAKFPESSGEIPEGSTLDQGTGIREQGTGNKKHARARASVLLSDFDVFWKIYPKKRSKGQAERTWEKLCRAKTLPSIEVLVQAVERQKVFRRKASGAGQWVESWANPSTWLNGRKWEDELLLKPTKSTSQSTLEFLKREEG
jgi:hypothetical protein